MATGFFAVFDDIAMLLDDTATMAKVATKKTAGILGDDLAVGAERASGYSASRELPVLWAISKGSLINKLVILPVAFLLSAFAPWSIIPILMIGGLYLAFEGAEKVYSSFFHHNQNIHTVIKQQAGSIEEYEKKKIKSAILTDFVLSIEIIVIALSTVIGQNLLLQIFVVTFIAFLATVGVYGLVAFIVRLDDMGLKLIEVSKNNKAFLKPVGQMMVNSLPYVIKFLSVVGTVAMFIVAGGIYLHHIHALHEWLHFLPSLIAEMSVGIMLGILVLPLVKLVENMIHK